MKVIITDLDRTLLHTDKTISDYTIDILQKCRQQGFYVLGATARPLRTVKTYMKQVHFNAITTLNGACTILMDRTINYTISLPTAKRIIRDLMEVDDALISVETKDGIFSNRDIPEWNPTVYENLLDAPLGTSIFKIIVSSEAYSLNEYLSDILPEDTYYTVADNHLFQIMSEDATKWNGILNMLAEYGLSPKDVVYFGDDNDDIESMKKSGTGVAVSNAIPPVLDIADAVTDTNDNDGVAKYIETNLLLN